MITFMVLLILSSIALAFIRLVKGPTIPDRIIAGDSIGIMFFSILILIAAYWNAVAFLDVALVLSILLFVDVLIMSKYLGSKEVESDD